MAGAGGIPDQWCAENGKEGVMSTEVTILADSVAGHGARITTYQLKFPRLILAQFNTHRALSRNASSTRAIPTAKMIEWVKNDPAVPIYWGSNKKGMQAGEELAIGPRAECMGEWLWARDRAIESAEFMLNEGLHKQIASRVLDPFAYVNVVATATMGGWMNFFNLRCRHAAQPEIQRPAVMMARAYRDSVPTLLRDNEWHLPYVTEEEKGVLSSCRDSLTRRDINARLLRLSVARCARNSYLTHDGKPTTTKADLALASDLQGSGHWSPFEHQATPAAWGHFKSANFVGWYQYRQEFQNQNRTSFDFTTLEQFA
jgi:thymidylate synthase ThyX